MADIKPFCAVRPTEEYVAQVAALPYDVYNRKEAVEEVKEKPYSFLRIDRAETAFDDSVDTYEECVYQKAKEQLEQMKQEHIFIKEDEACYYLYELIMDGRSQTGIVACSSIDDYANGVIKKHENTREDKELDRIHHVDTCNMQTGPIFLAYRSNQALNEIVKSVQSLKALYSFTSEDGVSHNVWKIANKELVARIYQLFQQTNQIYIADGHHRAASAVKVGLKRRQRHPGYDGTEEFNYFLSVLFPDDQLKILPYNRAIKDLNGLTKEMFLQKCEEHFLVRELGGTPYAPSKKGTFGMFFDGRWYELEAKESLKVIQDPVKSLDVSILQEYLLHPVLGIQDPRTDKRIEFIGGIRGLGELERRVKDDMTVAFSMYPTSITELFEVADANQLMPPKSTWFEPKLRSGIFLHELS